jgi:hypothetical protein
MDTGLVSLAHNIQLIMLVIALIMTIVLGARAMGQGPKGFALLLGEVAGLVAAVFFIIRPNDALHILTAAFGGVQTPVMPT